MRGSVPALPRRQLPAAGLPSEANEVFVLAAAGQVRHADERTGLGAYLYEGGGGGGGGTG